MTPTSTMFFVVIWLLASQITTTEKVSVTPLDEPLDEPLLVPLDAIDAEALATSFNTLNLADLDISASHAGSPRAVTPQDSSQTCVMDIWDQLDQNKWQNSLDASPDQLIEIADDFTLPQSTIIHSFKTLWFLWDCDHIFSSTEFRWDLYNKTDFAHYQPILVGPTESHTYALDEVELSLLGFVDCAYPIWMVEMVLDPPLELPAGDYVVAFGDVNPFPQYLVHILPEYGSPALVDLFDSFWYQFNWGDTLYDAAFGIVGQLASCSPIPEYQPIPYGPDTCPTTAIPCLTGQPTSDPTFQPTLNPVTLIELTCEEPTAQECDLDKYDITGTCDDLSASPSPPLDVETFITTTPGNCCGEQLIEITHECAGNGQFAQCMQSITTVDTTPPAIECPPVAVVYPGDSRLPDYTGFAICNDKCDPNVEATYVDETDECIDIFRDWECIDDCGNQNSCTQQISIICSDNPTFYPTYNPTKDDDDDEDEDDDREDESEDDEDEDESEDDEDEDEDEDDDDDDDDMSEPSEEELFNAKGKVENELNQNENNTQDVVIQFDKSVIYIMVGLCICLVMNGILCVFCKRKNQNVVFKDAMPSNV